MHTPTPPPVRHAWLLLALGSNLCFASFSSQAGPETPSAAAPPAIPPVATIAPATATTAPDPHNPSAPTRPAIRPPAAGTTAPGAANNGVEEVLKLARAGTSHALLMAFVENSATARVHRADDVLLLQTNGVPDEAIALMLKRGGAFGSKDTSGSRAIAMPAAVSALATEGRLDPESYEFWYYHYAYPRALNSAHEQLGTYQPRYIPYDRSAARHTGAYFDRGRRQVSPMGGNRSVVRR